MCSEHAGATPANSGWAVWALASSVEVSSSPPDSHPPCVAPQITVTILHVNSIGARRKLLDSVINVETQITVDSGTTAQQQTQALEAVTEVTNQMTLVRADLAREAHLTEVGPVSLALGLVSGCMHVYMPAGNAEHASLPWPTRHHHRTRKSSSTQRWTPVMAA